MGEKLGKFVILIIVVVVAFVQLRNAGCGFSNFYAEYDPTPQATEFLTHWQNQDYSKALTYIAPQPISKIDPTEFERILQSSDQLAGPMQTFMLEPDPPLRQTPGNRYYELEGVITFEHDMWDLKIRMAKIDSDYKIVGIDINPQESYFKPEYKNSILARIEQFHSLIEKQQFEDAYTYLTPHVKEKMKPSEFVSYYQGLASTLGPALSYTTPVLDSGGYNKCKLAQHCQHEKGTTKIEYILLRQDNKWMIENYKEDIAK